MTILLIIVAYILGAGISMVAADMLLYLSHNERERDELVPIAGVYSWIGVVVCLGVAFCWAIRVAADKAKYYIAVKFDWDETPLRKLRNKL